MEIVMFGSKKNHIVPPRPQPPLPEHIIEDLRSASSEDVAFNILNNDKSNSDDLHFPTNANDPANVYRKVKTYLDVNKKLKAVEESLCQNVELLKDVDQDIMNLAQEIKGQAQAAMVE